MDEADIRFYAQVQAITAEMNALSCKGHGMVVENDECKRNGQSVAWTHENFSELSKEFTALAKQFRSM